MYQSPLQTDAKKSKSDSSMMIPISCLYIRVIQHFNVKLDYNLVWFWGINQLQLQCHTPFNRNHLLCPLEFKHLDLAILTPVRMRFLTKKLNPAVVFAIWALSDQVLFVSLCGSHVRYQPFNLGITSLFYNEDVQGVWQIGALSCCQYPIRLYRSRA